MMRQLSERVLGLPRQGKVAIIACVLIPFVCAYMALTLFMASGSGPAGVAATDQHRQAQQQRSQDQYPVRLVGSGPGSRGQNRDSSSKGGGNGAEAVAGFEPPAAPLPVSAFFDAPDTGGLQPAAADVQLLRDQVDVLRRKLDAVQAETAGAVNRDRNASLAAVADLERRLALCSSTVTVQSGPRLDGGAAGPPPPAAGSDEPPVTAERGRLVWARWKGKTGAWQGGVRDPATVYVDPGPDGKVNGPEKGAREERLRPRRDRPPGRPVMFAVADGGVPEQDARQCLAGRWVLLYGDSTMRVLYNALIAALGAPASAHLRYGDVCKDLLDDRAPDSRVLCRCRELDAERDWAGPNGIRVSYAWKEGPWSDKDRRFFDRGNWTVAGAAGSAAPDVLVVNSGFHALHQQSADESIVFQGKRVPVSMSLQFASETLELARALAAVGRQRAGAGTCSFWRTTNRVARDGRLVESLFADLNQFATTEMAAAGVHVLDTRALTGSGSRIPPAYASTDEFHYENTGPVFADLLVRAVCAVCPRQDPADT